MHDRTCTGILIDIGRKPNLSMLARIALNDDQP